jgi:hypothetical protein
VAGFKRSFVCFTPISSPSWLIVLRLAAAFPYRDDSQLVARHQGHATRTYCNACPSVSIAQA